MEKSDIQNSGKLLFCLFRGLLCFMSYKKKHSKESVGICQIIINQLEHNTENKIHIILSHVRLFKRDAHFSNRSYVQYFLLSANRPCSTEGPERPTENDDQWWSSKTSRSVGHVHAVSDKDQTWSPQKQDRRTVLFYIQFPPSSLKLEAGLYPLR